MGFGGQLNQVMQNEKTSGHINIQLMFYKYFSSMNLKLLKPYLFMGMSLFFSGNMVMDSLYKQFQTNNILTKRDNFGNGYIVYAS